MVRRAVLLAVLLAFAPGCRGMGGVAAGLGKVAAGAATGIAKAGATMAIGVAKAAPVLAKGVAHAAPHVLRATEVVVQAALTSPDVEIAIPVGPPPAPMPTDPCGLCPTVDDCGACAGFSGYACVASPAGAPARCESSAPFFAPQAPDPEPDPDPPAPN
jgi:hypothetical protein